MKILKHGIKDHKNEVKAICPNCSCEFTYTKEDTSDNSLDIGSVVCPDCGEIVTFISDEYLLNAIYKNKDI